MDIAREILKEHSRRQAGKIALWSGVNKNRFAALMNLLLHGDYTTAQRASWVISLCADRHPALVQSWIRLLLQKAKENGNHPAVRRNIMRILQSADIPKRERGLAVNLCFDFLSAPEQPAAVKVFSMSVLARIAEQEPGLKNETVLVINQLLPYGSAGVRARAKKILARFTQ